MGDEKKFIEENIKRKKGLLQPEHKMVMDALYRNACKIHAVDNFEFTKMCAQSMALSEILKCIKGDFSQKMLKICLSDLEHMGFVMNTLIQPIREAEYAILPLGIEYIKQQSMEMQ